MLIYTFQKIGVIAKFRKCGAAEASKPPLSLVNLIHGMTSVSRLQQSIFRTCLCQPLLFIQFFTLA